MTFGPTVKFQCNKCNELYELGAKCRCAISPVSQIIDKVANAADEFRKVKNLEFELERTKIDRDELLRQVRELELLYEIEKECLRTFKAMLLKVKGISSDELMRLSEGGDDKPSEAGMKFSLLEIE